nr:MAG TPA: hypothetical protein [Caudoviricetes sp.]
MFGFLVGGPEVAVRTAVTACRSSPGRRPLTTRLSLPLPVLSSGPVPRAVCFGVLPYSFGLIILYSHLGAKSTFRAPNRGKKFT